MCSALWEGPPWWGELGLVRSGNVNSGLAATAWVSPRRRRSVTDSLVWVLVPGPRGDCSVIREESREEQVGRPAGRRRTDDAWVMQHWAGAQETGAQCGSPFQGKGSFLSVKEEIKRLSSPCV